jgi:cation transport ATPase
MNMLKGVLVVEPAGAGPRAGSVTAHAPRLRPRSPVMTRARIVLPIEGMSCASCAATVQDALSNAAGVTTATVNYATAKAAVDYDPARTHIAELVRTVRAAGYDCGTASVSFNVADLHYAPSVTPLERALARVKGVVRAVANQATETVTVDYVPGVTTATELERAVDSAGFQVAEPIATADPTERERVTRAREIRSLSGKFALAAFVAVVAMVGSMILMAATPLGAAATAKGFDLLGHLLMPLAGRLQALVDPGGKLDPTWIRGPRRPDAPGRAWSGQQFYRGA